MKRLLVILVLAALLLSGAPVGWARPAAPPQGGPMRLAGLPAVSHRVVPRPARPAWHAPARSGPGAVIAVTTTDDELNSDGDCSLREAIQAANTNSAVDACVAGTGDDTVVVPAGTYMLTLTGVHEDGNLTGDLDILDNLVLSGAGAASTILDGNNSDRVLDVQPGRTVEVDSVTVTHGYAVEEDGGGILNQGDLTVNDAVITLNVVDSPQQCHGGAGLSNFPSVQDASATLSNTLVTYNTGCGGGGLVNNPFDGATGVMVVSGSSVSHNTALGYAGGINNSWWTDSGSTAILTVTHSLVEYNDGGSLGWGGGIFNAGDLSMNIIAVLNVDQSTIRGNTAVGGCGGGCGGGGGIYSQGGVVTVDASTIRDNLCNGDGSDWSGRGGGVCLDGSDGTISNSTISGNQAVGARLPIANGFGGGIENSTISWVLFDTTLTLVNTTISDNYASTAGGGLNNTRVASPTPTAAFKNVLIAGNSAPAGLGENCSNVDWGHGLGVLTSLGNNLEDYNQCNFDQPTDLPDTDPLLGPLADNGGDTQTHALLAGSPAIDAGDDLAAPPTDQRGLPRPLGAASDIGAYEALLLAFDKTAEPASVHEGGVVTFTLTVRNTEQVTATDVTLSDLLPAGLQFVGPVTIEPPGAGQTGTLPLLAHDITLAPGQAVTVTFPARAPDGPALVTNTATLTSTEAVPLSASVSIEVLLFRVYLPVVLKGASR